MKVSILVPCFNEEEVINDAYQRIKAAISSYTHEIIFINDGSRDGTLSILKTIAAEDADVKVLNFSRNFGHQSAVTAGIEHCTGNVAVIMDADMQDPPELIPEMLKTMEKEQANCVYAVREQRQGESFFKKITARVFYRLLNRLSETKIPLDTGDFRLIDRVVIESFKKLPEKKNYIRGLVSWLGFKQVPFYYKRDARLAGETKYPLSKMIRFGLNGIISFTKKPLEIAVTMGLISLLLGAGLFIYALVAYFSFAIPTVSGWTSLIIVVLFFSGVQLVSIGLIGIYVGRLFEEVKSRPDYIIDNTINMD